MIIVWHWGQNGANRTAAKGVDNWLVDAFVSPLASMTWSSIDMFFVLSGFLIGRQLLHNKEADNFLGTFYLRRISRIVPLYVLWLVIYWLCLNVLGSSDRFVWLFGNPIPFWNLATLTQNFEMAYSGNFYSNFTGISWSVALEEQFYIVAPLLVFLLPRKWIYIVLGLMILAVPLWRMYAHEEISRLAPYVMLLGRGDALAMGVLIAAVSIRWPELRLNTFYSSCLAVCCVTGLSLGTLLIANGYNVTSIWMNRWGHSAFSIAYACALCVLLFSCWDGVRKFFTHRFLVRVGIHCYAIYLFHQPILGLVHGIVIGEGGPGFGETMDLVVVGISAPILAATAWLCWRYVELPFIKMGHQAKYKRAESLT